VSEAEEARAAEFRREQTARAAWCKANDRALAGSPEARRELDENWAAVVHRGEGWDPPETVACPL
jgi:hypothetical protein